MFASGHELMTSWKFLTAMLTFKRLIAGVSHYVILQTGSPSMFLTAVLTCIRRLVGVKSTCCRNKELLQNLAAEVIFIRLRSSHLYELVSVPIN